MRHRFIAPEADRLDKLIAAALETSRRKAQALASSGVVRVDGELAVHPATRVREGALVEVRESPSPVATPNLVELFRDDQVVVVDKPCGLPSQAARDGDAAHVFGLLSAVDDYVGLHHRLDTPASGLMLLTVARSANAAVARAFREGTIERRYLVVVLGDPGEQGRWSAPLDGKPAATQWRRLAAAGGMSVLEVRLESGRTHQIRRHAVNAGHPVIGDRRHGGAAGRVWARLALHAWRLRFDHPRTGAPVSVQSPLPDDVLKLFAKAGYSSVQPRHDPSAAG